MSLEFFIRLRDMMSGGLAKIAQTAQKTNSTVKSANGLLSQSYDQLGQKIRNLELSISKSSSVKHIREARRELDALNRMQRNHMGNTAGGSSGGGMLRQVLPAMGIAGIMALAGSALGQSAMAENQKISFEVMTGSKKDGNKMYDDIVKMADSTPFESQDLGRAGKTMLGYGVDKTAVMPMLGMLGDIAAASDAPADSLQSLSLAFGQVAAKGHLAGQETLQMINAGFNPLKEIAKMTGMEMGELEKAQAAGAITTEMVTAAFAHATGEGGTYHEMMKKQSQTLGGKWSTFMDGAHHKLRALGDLLAPIATLLMEFGTDLMSAEPGALALAAAIGVMAIALNWLSIVASAAAAKQWLLNIAMSANPIGLVIAGIAAIVGVIIYAWNKFEGFRMVVYGLWGAFKQVFSNIGEFFKKTFDPIFEAIQAFKEGRFLDAGKAVAKMSYNISVGMVANASKFALNGGLTKGVDDAYKTESLKGIRKEEEKKKSTSVGAAGMTGSDMKGLLTNGKGKASGTGNASDDLAKGITSGGPRVININGVRFADKIEIHAATFEKGMENVKDVLDEYLLRILNSGAAVQ